MHRSLQFGMRENPASDRRHGSRSSTNIPIVQPDHLLATAQAVSSVRTLQPAVTQKFNLPLTEPEKGATGRRKGPSQPADRVNRPDVEPPLTCEEAAAFVRVHPKTVKRMARNGELPGHF